MIIHEGSKKRMPKVKSTCVYCGESYSTGRKIEFYLCPLCEYKRVKVPKSKCNFCGDRSPMKEEKSPFICPVCRKTANHAKIMLIKHWQRKGLSD